MSDHLLELRNLSVRFRTKRGIDAVLSRGPGFITAVDEVDLQVPRGRIVGLVGESGSGKTTLTKTVLRLETPSSGEIIFDGRDIAGLSERQMRPMRQRLQMIFQDPLSSLNPRQRVAESLATPLRIRNELTDARIDERVDATLTRVGLSPAFRDRYPHEMSGGQLQRVAIGRALIVEPQLLVADEAVSKLDVSVRAQILNLFKDIQAETGITMLFITHDLHVARYICDQIGVMYFGKLVEFADTQTLFEHPVHPYTKALLGTIGATGKDSSRDIAGEAYNPTTEGHAGCRFLKRCPLRQPCCEQAHPDTEEISPGHLVQCHEWKNAQKIENP